jgi:hypothetical protein
LSAKLRRVASISGDIRYSFYCPGCEYSHIIRVSGHEPVWFWNGDLESPTIHPSIRLFDSAGTICHLWITDGNIQYLPDSQHGLADKTVPMIGTDEAPWTSVLVDLKVKPATGGQK